MSQLSKIIFWPAIGSAKGYLSQHLKYGGGSQAAIPGGKPGYLCDSLFYPALPANRFTYANFYTSHQSASVFLQETIVLQQVQRLVKKIGNMFHHIAYLIHLQLYDVYLQRVGCVVVLMQAMTLLSR